MNVVNLERVSKRYAEKTLLNEVSFGIDEGDRVGVIGRNGSGKSTLLRILAAVEEPDSGHVVHANHLRVAYLDQDPALDPSLTIAEAVRGRAGEAMADRLGIREPHRRIGELSGGQRKRVALARVLADDASLDPVGGQTGLLVLDEPTNHLDLGAVQWLEDRLGARRGALVLVTHDRYLLNRLATRIIEVHGGALSAHHGSYEAYLEARVQRAAQAEAAEQRRRNRARTELEWLRRAPAARTSKSKLRVARAQALIERPPAEPAGVLEFDLPSRRLGSKVVNLHRVGKRYGDRWVVRGIDHKLAPGARIGIVGPNGAGKTTLLGLIAGRIEPDEGSVQTGDTVVVGWYGQNPEPLPPNQRVFDVVDEEVRSTRLASGELVGAGGLLERFGFAPDAQRGWVGELSGGERRRLELLRVLAGAPNLLLLDEPTNDLDLDTLGLLEFYLDGWPGAFVVATHDRYFLDRVCHDVYSIKPDGSLRHHPGGWAAYARRGSEQPQHSPVMHARKAPSRGPRPGLSHSRLSYKERRELDQLGARLPRLEAHKGELERALRDAAGDYEAAKRLGDELTRLVEEIDQAETRWLELAEMDG
jgi:ATP-binding cassette subfamily F protein uup